MLTHRERVIKTLNHEEPDRVPLDLYFHAGMLTDPAYFALKEYLGIKGDILPFRQGQNANYYDERILEAFDVDVRRIFYEPQYKLEPIDGVRFEYRDAWGTSFISGPGYVHSAGHPLVQINTIQDLRSYPWPRPDQYRPEGNLKKQAIYLSNQTDYAVSLRRPGLLRGGLLDQACNLRGTMQFMMDLIQRPDYVKVLMEILAGIYSEIYALALEEVGPYIQIVETQDDLGGQQQPLISPKMWRDLIKPYQKCIFDTIRAGAPQAKIIFHSDGNIRALIPDLIEIGVDILNPIQPTAKLMESMSLKKEFGDRLCFHGAIDVQQVLTKDSETVRRDVRSRILALGPGGGYILSPCNHIQADIPPENIVAMYKTAQKYGQYPLK
jgi:uroporphyrinogen decarboxylase